ncbi:metallophosphoesterase family protein [Paenibacillus sp. UNC499MF]|uniref:metallophosphoesterase family protein n=1 Tax=Paenibacillus sp. UNC499MF TaxID=1502751 RepID=UPI0008A090B4|nr:metallophosphoesterase family protein [Paenibacillus sp. UNC499MF]SEG75091.1 serine/threonine protein phosphatase 1 [Paenibacillus sp. UNC499MF]
MKRTLVISDIHGEIDKFTRLLEQAGYDCRQDRLILLGDYVDKGPDSRRVVEKVMQLHRDGAVVLKGNHDHMMVKAFERDPVFVERWFRNGARTTLASYDHGGAAAEAPVPETMELTPLLEEHLAFLDGLQTYYETEDTIFVHAGVHPSTSPAETDPYVLIWIRDEFHKGYRGKKTVVFGHTITQTLHGKQEVYFGDNNIIGIDGGAVYGGLLHCLELPGRHVYSVK